MTKPEKRRDLPETIGPYRIEAWLGAGGMGEVYRAFDERLRRRVALKRVRADVVDAERFRRRFLDEVRAAARLNHPALVHIHDILEIEDDAWIVMELVEGESLAGLLEGGPLPPARVVALGRDLASGLAAAHAEKIVHRDLKGENVIVSAARPGHPGRAKILDFGLAKAWQEAEQDARPAADQLVGTPQAMSPEQAQGRDVDPRSDLFSLGTLLYQMLTGMSPFLGPGPVETLARVVSHRQDPVRDHAPDASSELSDLVERLLEKDPAARPQSAAEVARVLDGFAASRPDAPVPDVVRPATGAAPASAEPYRCGGERRRLTLLSCSLVGVGSSSGSLDPEVLFEVLSPFQNLVHNVVELFEGQSQEILGHHMVICFGYPRAHEDNTRRAVLAALEIVGRTESMAAEHGGALAARVGIHTGPAVILEEAATGGAEHLALGETLDLANGVKEVAEPGSVVVSAATRSLIEGLFVEQEPRQARIPGFAAPLEATRILSVAEARGRPASAGTLQPLVGRERELGLLADRFELAREGLGQVVFLSGEPGIGKSRLLSALADHLRPRASRWIDLRGLDGRGSAVHGSHALQPAAEILRQLLVINDDDPPDRQEARLEEALEELDFPVEETLPVLASLLRLDGRPVSEEKRRDILEMLPALVLETADREPLVILCEDVPELDATTRQLIRRLAEESAAAALLLLLTSRSSTWESRAQLTRLHLDRLDDSEIGLLVDQLAGDQELPEAERQQIIARADGVPRFAEELFRHAGGPGVPPTLLDALTSRLDRLGTAKETSQIAAALGREFSSRALAAVSAFDDATLERDLDRLLEAGVVARVADPAEQSYRFGQALFRDTAYASLLETDRERLRQRIESYRVAAEE